MFQRTPRASQHASDERSSLLTTTEDTRGTMGFITSLKGRLHSEASPANRTGDDNIVASGAPNDLELGGENDHPLDDNDDVKKISSVEPVDSGVDTIEAAQTLWGKKGRWLIIVG